MKYWRFHEPDTGDGQFMHYMQFDEARVFVETHFLLSNPVSKANADNYWNMFSHDVKDDYIIAMGGRKDESSLAGDFISRCLQVIGFQDVQVIESDQPLEPIYRLDEETQTWLPDEELE